MQFKNNIQSIFLVLIISLSAYAQQTDTTKVAWKFSGSTMITNNGFSIVPTFSLNSPATITSLYWRKNKFSIEPDIRLVPNATKGNMMFWLRYRLVEKNKFSLRVGGHPAFSFIRRTVTDNGKSMEITEMLRFAAFEIVPNYKITSNWSVGAVFLQGHGLQNHGPQRTDVLFLNTSISNINLGGDFRFHAIPVVYFLKVDNGTGKYVTGTGILSKKKLPFSLSYTFNKTISSNVAGNKDFMWNAGLTYSF